MWEWTKRTTRTGFVYSAIRGNTSLTVERNTCGKRPTHRWDVWRDGAHVAGGSTKNVRSGKAAAMRAAEVK